MSLLHVSGCFIQINQVSEFCVPIDAGEAETTGECRAQRTSPQELKFGEETLTFTDHGVDRD